MILNRILGQAKQINYKYVFGEIVLIFIGITLSLYFDEWQSRKAERKREVELLALIADAIPADTSNLSASIATNMDVAKRMKYLLDTGRYASSVDDKLAENLAFINHYFVFVPDLSAFENLKQEGMTLVKNQQLRIQMIRYYERMLAQADWTRNITKQHFELFSKYIIDDFDDYQFGQRGIPADFRELQADKRFWTLVKRTKMFCEVTAAQMTTNKRVATEFLKEIRKEAETR